MDRPIQPKSGGWSLWKNKVCAHDGPKYPCERPAQAKGFCMRHYQRQLAGKELDRPIQGYRERGSPPRKPTKSGEYRCVSCRQILEWTQFTSNLKSHNGLERRCRKCEAKRMQANLERAARKSGVEDHQQRCYVCKKILHRREFWKDRTRFNGLSSKCKQCTTLLHSKRATGLKQRVTTNPNY